MSPATGNLQERSFPYRGEIQELTAVGSQLMWVCKHPQNHATAIHRLNLESFIHAALPLPAGGLALLADAESIVVAGNEQTLLRCKNNAKPAKPKLLCNVSANVTKLAKLSEERLAAISQNQLLIIHRGDGSILQTFDLAESATAVASDPSGQWIAVGLSNGLVSVFECEDKDDYLLSESKKLHSGSVTALLYEPDELRFFSVGGDNKLLLTHARGSLEPEDRGRSNNHTERVTAIVHAPSDRIVTGSRDRSCKSWTRAGASKPTTLADGVGEVVDLATLEIHGRPHLAIASRDNSIRLFLFDTNGRFGGASHRIVDAYASAAKKLSHNEHGQRSEALTALAEYDDPKSIEMLAGHISHEIDHRLRLHATELLAKSKDPLAAKLLQPLLKHTDTSVRLAAFTGLCKRAEPNSLKPFELALSAKIADVGVAAVDRLAKQATDDELATQKLVETLDHAIAQVRIAAQLQLEKVLGKENPESNLLALNAKQTGSRQLALIRLNQRGLLEDRKVAAALRRAGNDRDAEVRRIAFLVGLFSKPKLAAAGPVS